MIMRCIPVPGDLWESYIGAGGWTEVSPNLTALKKLAEEGKPDAQVAVRSAQSVGKRVVEMTMIIKSGLKANHALLKNQASYLPLLETIEKKGNLRHS
jgi:hypothetical protein